MCSGDYQEDASQAGNNKARPPAGSKCIGACVYQKGRWGKSYCYTEADKGQWGAECTPCRGKWYFIGLGIFKGRIMCTILPLDVHLGAF